jgi:hypothetical protein
LFSPHFAEGEREASARAGFVSLTPRDNNCMFFYLLLEPQDTMSIVKATQSQKQQQVLQRAMEGFICLVAFFTAMYTRRPSCCPVTALFQHVQLQRQAIMIWYF